MLNRSTRRTFLRTAALATTILPTSLPSFGGISSLLTASRSATNHAVRLGLIGTGMQGRQQLLWALYQPDVQITAISDSNEAAISQALALFNEAGKPRPAVCGNGEEGFRALLHRDDVDGVLVATPVEWHTPVAVAAMRVGKYVGLGVSAATTPAESWALVDAFEQTRTPCMLLESVCYQRDALLVLNLIRQGLFGEINHVQSGYQHASATAGAAPYPTHGLGPAAHWLNINRGNRFTTLSSTVTKSRGLVRHGVGTGEKGLSAAAVHTLADVVTTTLHCANGETLVVIHESEAHRPYSPGFRVQGTDGIWQHEQARFQHPAGDGNEPTWKPTSAYQADFDHALWKNHTASPGGNAPNGADHLTLRSFVDSVKNRTQPPIDVYDAALWRSIQALSAQSLAEGGAPVEVPDFTRGHWQTNRPIFGVNELV